MTKESPLAKQYNKEVKIQRFGVITESGVDTDKEQYEDYILELDCMIQPIDESSSQDIEGNFGKDYLMFCNTADIEENDRVIDGADEYRVVGIRKFNFLGEDRHMELRIRKFNA